MTTLEDVAAALEARGIATQLITRGHTCLNVYADDGRVPTATVWPPQTEAGPGEWVWGHDFEFRAPADLEAVTVAARIAETLPPETQVS